MTELQRVNPQQGDNYMQLVYIPSTVYLAVTASVTISLLLLIMRVSLQVASKSGVGVLSLYRGSLL